MLPSTICILLYNVYYIFCFNVTAIFFFFFVLFQIYLYDSTNSTSNIQFLAVVRFVVVITFQNQSRKFKIIKTQRGNSKKSFGSSDKSHTNKNKWTKEGGKRKRKK